MKIYDFLKYAGDISEEAKIILSELLGVSLGYILSNGDSELSPDIFERAKLVLEAVRKGLPLQYALGTWQFYDRTFYVGEGALIPRQETELLVHETIKRLSETTLNVLELCTGTGVIGLTLKLERPTINITLTDISDDALYYAYKNRDKFDLEAVIKKGDLFEPVSCEKFDLIISNPPYIPTHELGYLEDSVRLYEPVIALDGGERGLDFYDRILREAPKHMNIGGLLALEIGYNQGEDLYDMAMVYGYNDIEVLKDFSNNDRIFFARR